MFKEIKSYTVLKAVKYVVNHTDIQRYGAIILWLGMMLYGQNFCQAQFADYAWMPGPKGVSGAGTVDPTDSKSG